MQQARQRSLKDLMTCQQLFFQTSRAKGHSLANVTLSKQQDCAYSASCAKLYDLLLGVDLSGSPFD